MNGILYLNTDIFQESERFALGMSLISARRKEKILQYKNPAPARLSLGAGVLLRIAMERCGIAEKQDALQYSAFGKPYLADADFHFNLSHSGTYAVCVYSDKPVGIDLQQIKDTMPKHTKKILSDAEELYLSSLKEREKRRTFYHLWGKKESLIKWDGRGLRLPLQELSFVAENRILQTITFHEKQLYFTEIDIRKQEYVCFVCSELEHMLCEAEEIDADFLNKILKYSKFR